MPHYSGGAWIRPVKRLAIYMRDDWICVYCACDVRESGNPTPTLEHVYRRHERRTGDYNGPGNLVLACVACNSDRNSMPLHSYLADLPHHMLARAVAELDRRTREPIGPHMAAARVLHKAYPEWLREIRQATRAQFAQGRTAPRPTPLYPPLELVKPDFRQQKQQTPTPAPDEEEVPF